MNTIPTNTTTRADLRFIGIAIVLTMVLSVLAIIGLGTVLAWLGESFDGTAIANYLAQVGEALGR
jgi:hypothetical protein